MNQAEFLTRLHKQLRPLKESERNDILEDFKEHFTIGLADGKSEAAIAASLGKPEQIANEILTTYHVENNPHVNTSENMLRTVLIAIGVGFFNLVFILGPVIGIAGIIFGGWVSGGAFTISPILVLFKYAINPSSFTLFESFLSIAMSGLGIFLLIGMYYVTKYSWIGFMHYLKFNIKLVRGGLQHD